MGRKEAEVVDTATDDAVCGGALTHVHSEGKRRLATILSEDEVNVYATAGAEKWKEMQATEDTAKAEAKRYRDQVTRLKQEIDELNNKVLTREEYRDVDCRTFFESTGPTGELVTIRLDTGEEVERRAASESERQTSMFGEVA